ncbi:peptidylprolyl isomerase [Colwellia hornerae]|uniref:Peptidyl-prolyl cis-trans isomerase n=1 Tax=Colwellia hornerae TaxID=89402 RepID=A0A5C6QPE8_9GAMM|nr:peptidylprolyl isomerase [Colwellia hornerae]TWX56340.1 GlyGly-CTERM sorting domain-containing protein [Colwellia hornerae]TWX62191.1 GlyGly-CTERM sorting domain-containing protein [Colwellia hornerae]TWX70593.1 GlyGly-CTERM sorting domain-containing protein [Colwellia hornerae]
MYKASPKTLALLSACSIATLLSVSSNATIVEFETSQGNFKVNLHDKTTPKTVENFLKYINDGDYNNTVIHRLVPNFIVQAGGLRFDGDFPLTPISVDSTVNNEPLYSNVRATIAMAKVGNSPNSATSQWFINYKDNSAILDIQNGGFTVFGEVIEGMDNLDQIALLPLCQDIPMPEYTSEQCANSNFVPAVENFVTINNVTIFNSSTTTAESLSPVKNTLINKESSSGDSSGGGSLSYLALLVLSLVGLRRKTKIS